MRLYLIRHGAVTVRPDRPGVGWHLSAEGRAKVETLAEQDHWAGLDGLFTSPEPKAAATAQRIAAPNELRIHIERDLREVENRSWVEEGYADQVRRYFAGEATGDWEKRGSALDRVRTCIGSIVQQGEGRDVGVVAHGLVLTLYVADLLELADESAFELWERIRFPDVAVVDPEARTVETGFGDGD